MTVSSPALWCTNLQPQPRHALQCRAVRCSTVPHRSAPAPPPCPAPPCGAQRAGTWARRRAPRAPRPAGRGSSALRRRPAEKRSAGFSAGQRTHSGAGFTAGQGSGQGWLQGGLARKRGSSAGWCGKAGVWGVFYGGRGAQRERLCGRALAAAGRRGQDGGLSRGGQGAREGACAHLDAARGMVHLHHGLLLLLAHACGGERDVGVGSDGAEVVGGGGGVRDKGALEAGVQTFHEPGAAPWPVCRPAAPLQLLCPMHPNPHPTRCAHYNSKYTFAHLLCIPPSPPPLLAIALTTARRPSISADRACDTCQCGTYTSVRCTSVRGLPREAGGCRRFHAKGCAPPVATCRTACSNNASGGPLDVLQGRPAARGGRQAEPMAAESHARARWKDDCICLVVYNSNTHAHTHLPVMA